MGKIMIQGTAEGVGKSTVAAALCRIFRQEGRAVVPFKPVSSYPESTFTADNCEIDSRMNILAAACRKQPAVLMNPVFLKPAENQKYNVIVMGKIFETTALIHHLRDGYAFMDLVKNAYSILLSQNEDIVVCGSGSCGDNYFCDKELGNMSFAQEMKLPVILVADCANGGTVGEICGTLYMIRRQKRRVQGVILNNCPMDRVIIEEMKKLIPVPVLGTIPTFNLNFNLDGYEKERIKVEIIRMPSMLGSSEYFPLENRDDTEVRYINKFAESSSPDLLIIPDCRSFSDAKVFLRETGFDVLINQMVSDGKLVIGIGNGYGVMGNGREELNILDVKNTDAGERYSLSFEGTIGNNPSPYFADLSEVIVKGTESAVNNTTVGLAARPALNGRGAFSAAGNAFGTSVHGLFECDAFVSGLMANLKQIKGIRYTDTPQSRRDTALDYLADIVRDYCDMEQIYKIMGDPYEPEVGIVR
ncbi:MAG: AAA family ATPase [Eubacteriales bacterium]|nr:AAA family ATPase [Eubacteriales bacterium]